LINPLRKEKERAIWNILLELYIDQGGRCIGDTPESLIGENHGCAGGGGRRHRRCGVINNLNLNTLVGNASHRFLCTYTSHQVLPPTRRSIVPNSISGRRKKITRRKLRGFVTETPRGYII